MGERRKIERSGSLHLPDGKINKLSPESNSSADPQPDYQAARNYWKVLKNRLGKEGTSRLQIVTD